MMIPPSFGDFGKSARDLFDKKFKFGYITVEHKAASSNSFNLTLNGEGEIKAGKVSGSLETKHKICADKNISINSKFDTKNILNIDMVADESLANGLKNTLSVSLNPSKEEFSTKLKTAYKRDYVNTTLDLEMKPEKGSCVPPTITATALVGGCPAPKYHGFYLGGEIVYDAYAKAVKKNQLRGGYQNGNLGVVANMLKLSEYQALFYQKVNSDLQVGVDFTWNKESKQSTFGVATQYDFDKRNKSFIKAKLNNNSLVGLTYGFTLADGVNAHLTTQVDMKNLEGGNHNLGAGIEFSF